MSGIHLKSISETAPIPNQKWLIPGIERKNLGVKIKEGTTNVCFDMPSKYLVGVSVPIFLKPWMPKASSAAKV
ncbi:MAG: hypothetical protein KME29_08830 [Calothrix sp. FI2-JRJ7]|nr:hypothetical protein [Calothrix sp. FI2-JRJ7]